MKNFRFVAYGITAVLLCLGVVYQWDMFGLQASINHFIPLANYSLPTALCASIIAPFPVNPEYTAISVAYRNKNLIADDVLPRVPVGKQEFKYRKYNLADSFTIPDTNVGRTGRPNQVGFGFTESSDIAADYGLEDLIPIEDVNNAPPGYDPLAHATESLTNLVLLDREKRAADLVFNANTYGASNKVTLAGNDQLSDFVNSDPIGVIMAALDAGVMRFNIMTMGRAVWTKFAQHPKIVKAVQGNAGDSGIARRQQIIDLFELEDLKIGEGLYSSAKKGQTPVLVPLWGKHISFQYRDRLAGATSGVTFGFTAQWGSRIAGSEPDSKIGLRGGMRTVVGESVKELVTANDLGYMIINAVA